MFHFNTETIKKYFNFYKNRNQQKWNKLLQSNRVMREYSEKK